MKITRCNSSLLFLLFLIPLRVYGDNLKEHTKLWTNLQITGSISKDETWNYYVDTQVRFLDDKYKFQELNLLVGTYYQITSYLSFWLGLFKRYEEQSSGIAYQENRIWEQIGWDILLNEKFYLTSRTRIEERKSWNNPQIANRLRERLSIQLPITVREDHYLIFSDEVFIQFNKPSWVVNRTFAQNRASIGLQGPVDKHSTYEVGYLNQFIYGNPNQMSNILYISYALDLG